ncbi:MAG: DUF948 domain-containing protein [Candidatus Aminicenantales bacterium]
MPLTLNQTLWLIIAVALVVAIAFLTALFSQLRRTARAAEETLNEVGKLVKDVKETDELVRKKIEDVSEVINTSKKAAKSFSEVGLSVSKILKPSTKYLSIIIPLLQIGWRQLKKKRKKEDKNVK